jgi:hypothetical protein
MVNPPQAPKNEKGDIYILWQLCNSELIDVEVHVLSAKQCNCATDGLLYMRMCFQINPVQLCNWMATVPRYMCSLINAATVQLDCYCT